MQFVIQELKGSPIRHLIAFSRDDNFKGMSVLEKAGFKINEPLKLNNYSKYFLSMTV